jgi:hypothetical protein
MYRINDVHATKLIKEYCRTTFEPGKDWSISRYDGKDCLMGGYIFNNYSGPGGSLQTHMCAFRPGWASKSLVYLSFHFPFRQLRVRKIIGLVPEANKESYNLCLHLGLKVEALIPDVYPFEPSGSYVMSIYAENCKWLGMAPPVIDFASRDRVSEMPVLH